MNSRPDPRSPIAGQKVWYEPEEIEMIAEDELRKAGLLKFDPATGIDIDRFAESHLKAAIDFSDLPKGVLGCYQFFRSGPPKITISAALAGLTDSISKLRVRTTLAHECGHALLHGPIFAMNTAPDTQNDLFPKSPASTTSESRILCRDVAEPSRQPERKGDWWEVQANKAMAALLMPKTIFRDQAQKFVEQFSLNVQDVALRESNRRTLSLHMQPVFHVSKEAITYRLDALVFPPAKQIGFGSL